MTQVTSQTPAIKKAVRDFKIKPLGEQTVRNIIKSITANTTPEQLNQSVLDAIGGRKVLFVLDAARSAGKSNVKIHNGSYGDLIRFDGYTSAHKKAAQVQVSSLVKTDLVKQPVPVADLKFPCALAADFDAEIVDGARVVCYDREDDAEFVYVGTVVAVSDEWVDVDLGYYGVLSYARENVAVVIEAAKAA